MIEYRGIHKSFDVPVLRDIDLTVATGETFGIVGPSGCGKSVLLKTTSGLITPDRGDVRIDGQSGGMRKRVGLARAIVARPEILLYDEPVTGLDPVNTAGVQRLIGTIARGLHATSVVVTHDVEGALEICDRIGLLHQGKLRLVGTPEEFKRSEDPVVRAFADRHQAEAASFSVLDA